MFESTLFVALFVLSLLWVASNALTMEFRNSQLLSPGFGIGKSMKPTLPGGVVVYIDHYPYSIEEGDIIGFRHAGVNICHRVVEIDGDRIRTKGDNNDHDDGWIDEEQVMSKVWEPFGVTLYIPLSPAAVRGTIERWWNDE